MKCRPRLLAATLALLAFTYGALAQSAAENTEKFTHLHLTATIQATDVDTIRNYLRVRLIDSVSMFLPKAFDDETFNFSGRALQGTEVRKLTASRGETRESTRDLAPGRRRVYARRRWRALTRASPSFLRGCPT
jgi:predicted metalloendopeptidase